MVAFALALDLVVPHGDPISVDFHTYVAAGQVGLEKGWSHIYDQTIVGIEQKELSPGQIAQPFLSPPTVAYITAPLAWLPYNTAYAVWALILFLTFAAALAWAGISKGWSRWIAVVGALGPWWVMHAVNVVFPWSICPIVPTFTCGFDLSNFSFAMDASLRFRVECPKNYNYQGGAGDGIRTRDQRLGRP